MPRRDVRDRPAAHVEGVDAERLRIKVIVARSHVSPLSVVVQP
jgi:hypothetical protein